MQVSAHWLRDYAKTDAPIDRIADRLTMTLNEVDAIRSLAGLSKVVVAEVASLTRHPNADSLWVVSVRAGRNTYQVVAGADNLAIGEKVPLARPSVSLPNGVKVGRRKIRGVASEGMLCSPRELGIGEDHTGVWLLPSDAKPGLSLTKALGSRQDSFDIDVPANRPDCLGHLGVAREAAAALGTSFREPALRSSARAKKGGYEAKIQDPAKGARFSLARLRGVKNGPSPAWLAERLTAVGLRPINLVVDITNFVMLEYGQPLHAYDAEKLTGVMLYARDSRPDESIKTIDGRTRDLPKGTLVIADRTQALGIAGIMGGAGTQVTGRTSDLVLESASFDAATVRRSSRALGLRTDASARFEKGLPADFTWPAIRRAVDLILDLAGGELVQLSDHYPRKRRPRVVRLERDRLASYLGISVPAARIKSILSRLGFKAAARGKAVTATPPYWRPDVQEEADLIEEVARQVGYDRLPSRLPKASLAVPERPPLADLSSRVRDTLIGLGLTEVLTHSLVGRELLEKTGYPNDLVAMENPLSEDHAFLRGSLGPRHLEAVAANLRWRSQLGIFEIGRVFKPKGKAERPLEPVKLLVSLASKSAPLEFGEIRGLLTALAGRLYLDSNNMGFEKMKTTQFKDYFRVLYGKVDIGALGQYRYPKRFKAESILQLSLNLDRLITALPEGRQVVLPASFPTVTRDLSLYVPDDATYATVRAEIERVGGELLRSVGDPEEFQHRGKRSLTIRLTFGSDNRTLTDKEIEAAMKQVTGAVKKSGWKVRE
jgi:phenylalanyl-tRNA synthetase beta chain